MLQKKKSKLKRRLRKKLHVGEFQEFGFEVLIKFKSNLDEAGFDKFVDEFIDKVEENKLLFGGGGGADAWSGFITTLANYQSPSIVQKEKIKDWLENHQGISECKVGNLKDAWYDNK